MAVTPPIWSDVSADLATALSEARRAADKAAGIEAHPPDLRESVEMAVGKHLHDAYCAAEAALERLILAMDGEVPTGRRYHRELLERAARPIEGVRAPMIRTATRDLLEDLLRFRHAYGTFAWDRAAPNVGLAAEAIPMLAADLTAFARPAV